MQAKIKVMVIDDSLVFRGWLINSIRADARFEVVGFAVDAFDAKKKIPLLKPDIITLDIEMPGMSGIDFLRELLPVHPIPVILVSSLNVRVFDALALGAIDFVRKPDPEQNISKELFLSKLLSRLALGATARVRVPHSQPNSPSITALRQTAAASAKTLKAGGIATGAQTYNPARTTASYTPPLSSLKNVDTSKKLIAIGASTGGTEAILEVVRQFPANMPGVVITQHMPPGFTAMYAERLNRLCKMEVKEAQNGDKVRPGLILLAPGGLQMRVVRMGSGYAVSCNQGEKVSGHCPSVDVLFDSVSSIAREHAIGILLTGMGADGAAGLLRMRKNGAFTIGQDRETCVVYGMPMEAYKIGAVCKQAPLGAIPQLVMSQLSRL